MNGKFVGRWFQYAFVLPTLTFLAVTTAQAASIGLTPGDPNVAIGGALVNYTAPICYNSGSGSSTATGICGTTGSAGKIYGGALVTPGMLTVTDPNNVGGTSGAMYYTGNGNVNAGFYGDFTLTAYFNASGVFGNSVTAGSTTYTSALSLVMTGGNIPNVSSTSPFTIVTANLGAFGFSGSGSGGVLEFAGGPGYGGGSTGGFWNTFSLYSGNIANTTITSGAPGTGISWDSDATLFKRNWSGTAAMDTFVPIPAAAWLFGSGLVALVGMARRRRRRR